VRSEVSGPDLLLRILDRRQSLAEQLQFFFAPLQVRFDFRTGRYTSSNILEIQANTFEESLNVAEEHFFFGHDFRLPACRDEVIGGAE
jgi:hypothetical protein